MWVSRSGDIETLIRDYHLSFLGPAGKHEEAGNVATLAQLRRALGYNLHLDRLNIGTGFSSGGLLQVGADIGNSGSAPAYHRPRLRLSLLDSQGAIAWSGDLPGDLSQALPGQTLHLDASFQLPPTLAPGSYALRAELADRSAARPATLLQSGPRDAQGRVMLGTATVTGGNLLFASGFE